MANDPALISLHVLILESSDDQTPQLEPMLRSTFPSSLIQSVKNIRRAESLLRETLFDLVVLCMNPLRTGHQRLLTTLKGHATPMPTLIVIKHDDELKLHEYLPQIPPSWEIAPRESICPLVIEQRVRKAVANHQHQWELSHLQRAFHSSLIQYRNLFDEVPDLIFLCDRSGCLLEVNAAAVRLFGRPKENMLMRPIFETFGMKKDDFEQLLSRALTHQGPLEDFEIELHPKGQTPIYGLTHLVRWQSDANRPVQFQGVIKDISPHKHLERQLRQSEDQYKTLYELAQISSSSLRIDEMTQKSLSLIQRCCGASGTLLLLNNHQEMLDMIAAINFPENLRLRFIDHGPPVIGKDLIGRWALTPGLHRVTGDETDPMHPVLADWMEKIGDCQLIGSTLGQGNPTLPTSILLMAIPADLQDTLDEALLGGLSKTLEMGMTNCFHYANTRQAELRYRELWENAPAFFISILKSGEILEINQTAAQALGYKLPELIGKPFKHLIDPADHDLFERHHRNVTQTGNIQSIELRLIQNDGHSIIASIQFEPLLNRDEMLIGAKCVLHDITHDKQLEAQLRDWAVNLERKVSERTIELTQTMNFLNGILEGSTEYAIFGLDPQGAFLHFSSGGQLIFGYDASAMVDGETLERLIDFNNGPWKSLGELIQKVDLHGVEVKETTMVTKDGRSLTCLMTINRLKSPATNNLTFVAIVRDITEQKELEELLRLYTENLQQVIEQKTRELDRQHIQLIQSSKLATLGEMATGIAHELHQPLSGIRTRAQLVTKSIQRNMGDNERITRNQIEITQLVDRITRIIHHMRIFARQDELQFAPFKINQSIEGAISLMGEQLRIHAIDVTREIPDELPSTYGEPLQIEQVILNLFSNARDSMDARAEQLNQAGQTDPPFQKQLVIKAYATEADEICIRISDNGTGMDAEVKTKIFDPFFTTKPVGRGTGLGLSISYGILTNHKGRMEVDSQPDQGTTFSVFLPIWKPAAEELEAAQREEESP